MGRYSLPTRQLIAETFWAAARGFERDGRKDEARAARECARLVRHGYQTPRPEGAWAGAEHRSRR